jgi:DNA-binding FadR family transcriptional regulator
MTKRAEHHPAQFADLDAEFHRLISRAAHNRVLLLAKEPASMLVTTDHRHDPRTRRGSPD